VQQAQRDHEDVVQELRPQVSRLVMRAVERLVDQQEAGGEVEPADLGMRVRLPVLVVVDGRAKLQEERAKNDDGEATSAMAIGSSSPAEKLWRPRKSSGSPATACWTLVTIWAKGRRLSSR
jgi:hypothetical protein